MGQATDNRKKDMPETFYISIGSGSEYALKLLDSELKDLKVIDPKNAIELASWAVREATRNDIYSAGSDLVVITSEEIQQFGRQIKDASDEAVRQVLSDIVDKFQ
jgi:20S proteasome alpha/beta subunit